MLLWGSNFGLSHIHCWSVHQPGSRLKYVNNHWLHRLEPWQPWCPQIQEVRAGSPWRSHSDLFLETHRHRRRHCRRRHHHEADTRVSNIVLYNYVYTHWQRGQDMWCTHSWSCQDELRWPLWSGRVSFRLPLQLQLCALIYEGNSDHKKPDQVSYDL